jgi:DNA invertase Pin-like site-specific DNA recombinase
MRYKWYDYAMNDDEELDITKLRYVLYARKSTTDEQRQIRSIPDQIAECQQLAANKGIKVVEVLEEIKSAKKPNQRPIFTQMLADLKRGKYDGILAWHPDRLSRNMREGGEIIDMIDEEEITDLKFVTHHFTNDATGKMLLGMSFVLSKQYSDDLSQKVTRGVRRGFAEGKSSGTPKHGYVREDGYYRPDGKNFEIMQNAWRLRKEGEHLEVIASTMNEQGYSRVYKAKAKKVGQSMKMDKKTLSKIFKDSFYYGMLLQANKAVDLRIIYDFVPTVSEADWNAVQQLSNRSLKPSKSQRTLFLPLRRFVICHYCKRNMLVAASPGRTKRYLNYRCDFKTCPRIELGIKRNIRGKVVFDYIYNFLKDGLKFTEVDYEAYSEGVLGYLKNRRGEIQTKLHSKEGALKATRGEAKEKALKAAELSESNELLKYVTDRVLELEQQSALLEQEITALKRKLDHPEQELLSVDQFLNLSKNASAKVKAGNTMEKDKIVRLIFLNLELGDQIMASHKLKEPFATLLKNREVSTGRGERTRTFDLLLPKQAR